MAEIVWAVLCDRVINDSATGQLSLVDVVESLTVHTEPPAPGEALNIPRNMNVVVYVTRSDLNVPEKAELEITLELPDRAVEPRLIPISLESDINARIIVNMAGIPVSEAGTYRFIVELKGDGASDECRVRASIPLAILFESPA